MLPLLLILSFVGVKHSHIQRILENLTKDSLPSRKGDRAVDLGTLLHGLQVHLQRLHYTTSLIDLEISWHIVFREESVCILLGGTSGCGKSTLASLLAHRIGITTVVSTDHVRGLLRSFDPTKSSKVLWASSYHVGEDLTDTDKSAAIIAGYEAQSQLMLDILDKMMTSFEQRKESLVIEGVALSIENIRYLASKHRNCIPLIIYISNKNKHSERFAIRAKYMTVAPRANKYIRYFDNIRLIQNHLCQMADEWMVPKIDNTNVDRSLAILHMTVINSLSRMKRSNLSSPVDARSGKLTLVHEEFSKVYRARWSSKQTLRSIRQNSSRSRSRIFLQVPNEGNNSEQEQASCGPDDDEYEETKSGEIQIQNASGTRYRPSSVLLACQTRWKAIVRFWTTRT